MGEVKLILVICFETSSKVDYLMMKSRLKFYGRDKIIQFFVRFVYKGKGF